MSQVEWAVDEILGNSQGSWKISRPSEDEVFERETCHLEGMFPCLQKLEEETVEKNDFKMEGKIDLPTKLTRSLGCRVWKW